ncbi:MAG: S8 family serine peptidase [Balneolales bacterium]|nr:S8 family serine peptidase [Balneolales bacterium]
MTKTTTRLLTALVVCFTLALQFSPANAQDFEVTTAEIQGFGEINFIPNRVIIRFNQGVQSAEIASIQQQMNAEAEFSLNFIGAEVWSFRDRSMNDIIAEYASHPLVDFIQPDIIYDLPEVVESTFEEIMEANGFPMEEGIIPNDPQFNLLWGLRNMGGPPFNGIAGADISAPEAWEMETGDQEVVIAVLDSGVDYNHPDLSPNMWQDADGNFGANFAGGPINNPMDNNGHGTHVAGTIAAVGNNGIGITGVMWNARIMAVRVCGNNGCPQSAIVQGVTYAIENGAMISNNSYGTQTPTSAGPSPAYVAMAEAAQQAGHFFITSAGNSNNNNDILNVYPANLMRDFDNVFSVGNSTPSDTRNPGSCFGAETVHVFAPGTNIRSTIPNGGYTYLSGTSMASPHVAGLAGLILSANPDADYHFIRDRIMEGVDVLPAFENISISGGRINAANSVLVDDGVPPATISDLSIDFIGQNLASLSWTAVGNSGMEGRAGSYEIRFSTEPITDTNFESASMAMNIPRPANAGTEESFFVRGLENSTTYYFAIRTLDVFGNESGLSNVATSTTDDPASISISVDNITDEITVQESSEYTFTVTNNGEGTLRYFVPASFSERAASSLNPVNALDCRFRVTEASDGTESGNPVLQGTGGPDQFGYFWVDDEELQGLTFSWNDISETGTELSFGNQSSGSTSVDLPFAFPFYGDMKESINIAINGFASFVTIPTTGAPNNAPLPVQTTLPRDLIAPFWNNLQLGENGAVYVAHNEADNTFIIQWDQLNRNNDEGANSYTFQAILSAGGNITFQYLEMDGVTDRATIGIQSPNTEDALQVAYNSDYAQSLKSVNLSQGLPSWLAVSPVQETIEPGASVEVTVNVDGSDFVNGLYEWNLMFLNNDLDNAFASVPIAIEAVGGLADVSPASDGVDFGLVYIDYPESIEIELINSGRADLVIDNFGSDNPFISAELSNGTNVVPALSSAMLVVTYNPTDDDELSGTLSIESANPEQDTIEIVLNGSAAGAPDLRLNRAIVNVEVEEGQIVPEDINFRNAGGSILNYTVSFSETTQASHSSGTTPGSEINSDADLESTPSWILFVQNTGSLDPGEIRPVTVRFRGNVEPGSYSAVMSVSSNDPANPVRTVQLNMTVVTPSSTAGDEEIPRDFALNQNYPNPFNPTTQIEFALPEASNVTLEVFNLQGQRVATLVNNEMRNPGIHSVMFDAAKLSSGMYIYRLQAGSFIQTQKMMLVK